MVCLVWQPDGSGVTVTVTTDGFFPFVNGGGGGWLRCRFGGENGGVTVATFVTAVVIECGVPFAAGNAGAIELAVSLNGQQYHPVSQALSNISSTSGHAYIFADAGLMSVAQATTFSFHYTPVVFSLSPPNASATPPIGPDTGGARFIHLKTDFF